MASVESMCDGVRNRWGRGPRFQIPETGQVVFSDGVAWFQVDTPMGRRSSFMGRLDRDRLSEFCAIKGIPFLDVTQRNIGGRAGSGGGSAEKGLPC